MIRAAALALLAAGCAATAPNAGTFDRCATGRVIDGCDVSDLPPLTAMLPPWPFPTLREVPTVPPPAPPRDTPGGRLIQRLTK